MLAAVLTKADIMTDDANPFAFWQQVWQDAQPNLKSFMPPTSLEEVNRKLSELDNVETWLRFHLQALAAQKAVLQQQQTMFENLFAPEAPIKNPDEAPK